MIRKFLLAIAAFATAVVPAAAQLRPGLSPGMRASVQNIGQFSLKLKPLIALTNERFPDASDSIPAGGFYKERTEHQFGFNTTKCTILLPVVGRSATSPFPEVATSGYIQSDKLYMETNGISVPITFAGSPSILLAYDGTHPYLESDPVNASAFGLAQFSRDSYVYFRNQGHNTDTTTARSLPNGEPTQQFGSNYATYASTATPVDDTASTGSLSYTGGSTAALGFPIFAKCTPLAAGSLSVAHVDDSIGVGFQESWNNSSKVPSGYGYFNRAELDGSNLNAIAGINMTRATSTLGQWLNGHAAQDEYLKLVNVAAVKHGTNDFSSAGNTISAVQMEARFTSFATNARNLGVQRIVGIVPPPRTDSVSPYTEPVANWASGGPPDVYIQWLKAGAGGAADAVVDIRGAGVEDSGNLFHWAAGMNAPVSGTPPGDGIHPTTTAHKIMASAYRTVLLGLVVDGGPGGTGVQVPGNLTAPTISGTAQAGQILTSSNGTWSGSPTSYSRQWYADPGTGPAAISGATATTYTLTSGQVGSTMTVAVAATNSAGTSAPVSSDPTSAVTAATSGTVFFLDHFDSGSVTTLQAHTPDTGSTWTRNTTVGSSGAMSVGTGGRMYTGTVPAGFYNAVTPTSADYDVEGVLQYDSTISSGTRYLGGRAMPSATDASGYWCGWNRNSSVWQMSVTDAAFTRTTLGTTSSANPPTVGSTNTVKLSMRGSTITCSLNGTVIISATDSTISGAGHPALTASNTNGTATTTMDWNDLKATAY